MKRYLIFLTYLMTGLLLILGSSLQAQILAIKAGEIHTMEGEILRDGIILIKEGKILAIGQEINIPDRAEILDAQNLILYPGFIASSVILETPEVQNFESVSPDTQAADRFDAFGDYFRFLAYGITAAYISPGSGRFVSGKGAVVKLGGAKQSLEIIENEASLELNFTKEAQLPPKVNVYPAPVSPENPITPAQKQYPSSFLGCFWALQKLFRFEPYTGDLAKYKNNILLTLKQAQQRKIPLVVQCHKAVDIYHIIHLAEIIQMPLILHGASEACRLTDLLKEKNVSVIAEIYPELKLAGIEENRKNICKLIEKGIPVALSGGNKGHGVDLFWHIQYFRKYGIEEENLLKTITVNPSRMFGVDSRIGSLAKGKDADILFFQRIEGNVIPVLEKVMIEGKIVDEME